MKISELTNKAFLNGENAASQSYVLVNYEDDNTNEPVTYKASLDVLGKAVAANLNLPQLDTTTNKLVPVTTSESAYTNDNVNAYDLGAIQTALAGKVNSSAVGAASGVASLDASGKVPAAQLPSYVDDVVEYADSSAFPGTGESGKIYIALDTGKVYRWGGSAYAEIANPDLSIYATKADPEFTGSISLGRAANSTVGTYSIATGQYVTASGNGAHAEGMGTTASGVAAHAEGGGTTASGVQAHAEGSATNATGKNAHAEGNGTTASGTNTHVEGAGSIASGAQAHAEGASTNASGVQAHAEGAGSIASGSLAHAEGGATVASGANAHAEGGDTIASGVAAHVEGLYTKALGVAEHVSGQYNIADTAPAWTASTSYSVGDLVSKDVTFTDGGGTQRTRTVIYKCKTANSDAEFTASKWDEAGQYLVVVGNGTANNARSNAYTLDWNGNETLSGNLTVLGGHILNGDPTFGNTASGVYSQAHGQQGNTAAGNYSVAIGNSGNTANADFAIAVGKYTNQALGEHSIALGANNNQAIGDFSVAIGKNGNVAGGDFTETHGWTLVTPGKHQHAIGQFNIPTTAANWAANTTYAVNDLVVYNNKLYKCVTANSDAEFTDAKWEHTTEYLITVGNGTNSNTTHNAYTLDWNGNGTFAGKVTVGTAPSANMDVATKQYVDTQISNYDTDNVYESGYNGKYPVLHDSHGIYTVTGSQGGTTSLNLGGAAAVDLSATYDMGTTESPDADGSIANDTNANLVFIPNDPTSEGSGRIFAIGECGPAEVILRRVVQWAQETGNSTVPYGKIVFTTTEEDSITHVDIPTGRLYQTSGSDGAINISSLMIEQQQTVRNPIQNGFQVGRLVFTPDVSSGSPYAGKLYTADNSSISELTVSGGSGAGNASVDLSTAYEITGGDVEGYKLAFISNSSNPGDENHLYAVNHSGDIIELTTKTDPTATYGVSESFWEIAGSHMQSVFAPTNVNYDGKLYTMGDCGPVEVMAGIKLDAEYEVGDQYTSDIGQYVSAIFTPTDSLYSGHLIRIDNLTGPIEITPPTDMSAEYTLENSMVVGLTAQVVFAPTETDYAGQLFTMDGSTPTPINLSHLIDMTTVCEANANRHYKQMVMETDSYGNPNNDYAVHLVDASDTVLPILHGIGYVNANANTVHFSTDASGITSILDNSNNILGYLSPTRPTPVTT